MVEQPKRQNIKRVVIRNAVVHVRVQGRDAGLNEARLTFLRLEAFAVRTVDRMSFVSERTVVVLI